MKFAFVTSFRLACRHLMLGAVLVGCAPALAQDATWDGSGLAGLFNDDDNWTPAGTPTGTATFAGAGPFNIHHLG